MFIFTVSLLTVNIFGQSYKCINYRQDVYIVTLFCSLTNRYDLFGSIFDARFNF